MAFLLRAGENGFSYQMPGTDALPSPALSRTFLPVVAGALLCLGAGGIAGWASSGGGGSWYQSLAKPPGTPPAAVFGPVWSVLYLMIGAAGGLLFVRGGRKAQAWFGVQLLLNLVWTPVFFGMQRPALALGIILALLLAIGATILSARKVCRPAVWLLLPYALWVCYASYLNAGIVFLN